MLAMLQSWSERRYRLDRMTLGDLVVAFFTHYSVIVYLTIAAIGLSVALLTFERVLDLVLAALAVVAVYPFVEYFLHRFVLHGRFLFRWKSTARIWKRIHYDHHQNPHDLSVLFGALYTTLPPLVLITVPLGWLIGGPAGAAMALATGCLVFAGYEFCHCVQHLPFTPKNRWLREIKKRHLAHHFHSEQGNFGITTGLWDRVFGTIYERQRDVPKSPTTYNLGYGAKEREAYPWVAEISASEEELTKLRTRRPA